jgi:hypothetical protein
MFSFSEKCTLKWDFTLVHGCFAPFPIPVFSSHSFLRNVILSKPRDEVGFALVHGCFAPFPIPVFSSHSFLRNIILPKPRDTNFLKKYMFVQVSGLEYNMLLVSLWLP